MSVCVCELVSCSTNKTSKFFAGISKDCFYIKLFGKKNDKHFAIKTDRQRPKENKNVGNMTKTIEEWKKEGRKNKKEFEYK